MNKGTMPGSLPQKREACRPWLLEGRAFGADVCLMLVPSVFGCDTMGWQAWNILFAFRRTHAHTCAIRNSPYLAEQQQPVPHSSDTGQSLAARQTRCRRRHCVVWTMPESTSPTQAPTSLNTAHRHAPFYYSWKACRTLQ